MNYPEISFHEMMNQASMTAHDYMLRAERDIDAQFGEGFAKKNPILVAGYMKTCALDYGSGLLAKAIGSGLESIARAGQEGL